jgi:acetolactate synthase I/II/III large subunit
LKISDYIIDTIVDQGVSHIFEVCGGAITHLLDSLYERSDIHTISMHHEMAAAIAAEGYARASGNIGVAMATSGPGATNLLTGIGSCYFDSIPCLFITGQVNTYEYKYNKPIRQLGFQETDIVSIVKPISKMATIISNPDEVVEKLSESFQIAKSGRPGPVLLDIPLNIQRAQIDVNSHNKSIVKNSISDQIDSTLLSAIKTQIISASRPIILAGGGIRISKAMEDLMEFAHKTGIPVAVSLMGLDAYPHNDPLYVGMIGTYGNRHANLAIANADTVIALGTRLDTRQTGTNPKTFARGATIIHVDIDPSELNNKIIVDYPINSDAKHFLSMLNRSLSDENIPDYSTWHTTINRYKNKYAPIPNLDDEHIDPYSFLNQVSNKIPDNAIICVDVGQNQMWAAQSMNIKGEQRFLTQGGMASIGSALPMAIGASFAKPENLVVVLTGDGGIQLNIQELQTIYHHQLPIKIILLNNSGYGMIRQFQEQYLESRFQSSVIGYSNPDFQRVACAYNIKTEKISLSSDIQTALNNLLKDLKPGFLEVIIDEKCRVSPKLGVNRPIEDQEPLISRDELRSNMIVDMLPENEKL